MKKKNFLFITFASVLFFSVFIFYVFFYPMNKKKTVIELVKGDRLTMVADRLYDAKIINSKFFFKLWMYLSWNQNNLKVGEYEIAENASLNDIKNTVTKKARTQSSTLLRKNPATTWRRTIWTK